VSISYLSYVSFSGLLVALILNDLVKVVWKGCCRARTEPRSTVTQIPALTMYSSFLLYAIPYSLLLLAWLFPGLMQGQEVMRRRAKCIRSMPLKNSLTVE